MDDESKEPPGLGRNRWIVHCLLWVVALFAVLAGICCDSKTPQPPAMTLAGFALFGAALALGLWLVKIDEEPRRSFWRLTHTGVVVWVLMFAGCSAILTPIFKGARSASSHTQCLSNQRQLMLGVLMYAADFDDRMPRLQNWRTATLPYIKNEFECPDKNSKHGYALNRALSGASTLAISEPATTVATFDMDASVYNAGGSAKDLVYRHLETTILAAADGHAKRYRKEEVLLRWNP